MPGWAETGPRPTDLGRVIPVIDNAEERAVFFGGRSIGGFAWPRGGRKGMRTACRLLMTSVLLATGGGVAFAGDHVASSDVVQGRLLAASGARARDLAQVDAILASPQAERGAAALGVDVARVRAATATLSDAELRDLATRASALDRDPRSGLSHDVDELLVIFLIVAIVILVIKAVD